MPHLMVMITLMRSLARSFFNSHRKKLAKRLAIKHWYTCTPLAQRAKKKTKSNKDHFIFVGLSVANVQLTQTKWKIRIGNKKVVCATHLTPKTNERMGRTKIHPKHFYRINAAYLRFSWCGMKPCKNARNRNEHTRCTLYQIHFYNGTAH